MAIVNGTDITGTGLVTGDGDGTFTYSTVTQGGVLLGGASNAVSDTGVLAKGSIIVGDGTTDPEIVAVGTNDYILTADSAQTSGVKWAAAAAGGGGMWEYNSTASPSATAQVDFTDTGTTGVKMIIPNLTFTTDCSDLWVQFSGDSGSTFPLTRCQYSQIYSIRTTVGASSDGASNDIPVIQLSNSIGGDSSSGERGISLEITILNMNNASAPAFVFSTASYMDSTASSDTVNVRCSGVTSDDGTGSMTYLADVDTIRFAGDQNFTGTIHYYTLVTS